MSILPSSWERFRLSPEEVEWRKTDFGEPILHEMKILDGLEIAKLQTTYKKTSGIYFWLLNIDLIEYKVYIGKTNSLSNRLANYIADFQPHSPNDFKLRIFEQFVQEVIPTASMSLFFARKDIDQITEAENWAIEKYKCPLLNQRAQPTIEAKAQLQDAFKVFYQSSWTR